MRRLLRALGSIAGCMVIGAVILAVDYGLLQLGRVSEEAVGLVGLAALVLLAGVVWAWVKWGRRRL